MSYGSALTLWKKKSVQGGACHGISSRIAYAAVNMMGAVSPATRAIPRIDEVKIPGRAYGKTFFRIVCHLVAPSASEPSRNPFGTARNDSSLAVMIAGRTIKPSVNQPENSETFQPKKITNNPNPNNPNTIDGTPARFRIAIRIKRMNRPSRLYSLR